MKTELESVADVEVAMNELQQLESQQEKELATANAQIARIRTGVTPAVTALEEKATRLRNSIVTWAKKNRKDKELFPDGRKTLDLLSGSIAFRTGALSVTLRKGYDTEDVIKALKEAGIKNVTKQADPTLDKSAIKKLYEQDKIDEEKLKELGLVLDQEETINVTLKTVDKYELAK